MSNENCKAKNKRGRPRAADFPIVSFRYDPDWTKDIDEWRRGEPGKVSRSEAIRDLLGRGLSAAYKEREQAARKRG
jgi:hypothetical protein